MLVIVLNDSEIDSDGPALDAPSRESLNMAVGGNCANPLPKNVPDSLSRPTGWLLRGGCEQGKGHGKGWSAELDLTKTSPDKQEETKA